MREKILNLLLVVMSLFIAFAAAELTFRMLVYRSFLLGPGETTEHKLFCEYDPLLGWRHHKGMKAVYVNPEFKASLQFNSMGFRGPEIPFQKPADIYRVLLVGDSYTEGYTVNREDSFAEVLKKKLSGNMKDKRIEVINAGVGGYSTDQELLFMESQGTKLRPDLTILMFCENDVYYNTQPNYWRGFKPYFVVKNDALVLKNVPVPKPAGRSSGRRSYLASFISDRLKKRGRISPPPENRIRLAQYDAEIEASWLLTEKLLQKFKATAEATGGLLIVYIPPRELIHSGSPDRRRGSPVEDKMDMKKPAAILKAICERNQIEFLDLTEGLRQKAKSERLYFAGDPHWNKTGHQTVGVLLADDLWKENLSWQTHSLQKTMQNPALLEPLKIVRPGDEIKTAEASPEKKVLSEARL